MQVCTVINKAWVAHARALAESLAAHEPGARLTVLVVDPLEGLIDAETEPFELIGPEQLELTEFGELSARYDVGELCCALKPAVLLHALRHDEVAVYLDSDVRVLGPLGPVEDALREHELLLTPHLLRPLPDDGKEPGDHAIVLAGLFNMGFAAARPGEQSEALLRWWSGRLRTGSRLRPADGLVYDQRWAELMPGLAEGVAISRDPGLNFGYWRAPGSSFERRDGAVLVDGVPLRSFHFTGLDERQPERLSRYDSRSQVDREPVLAELLAEFNERLAAHGHELTRRFPYTFGATAAGTALTPLLRELWDRARFEQAVVETPFSDDGEASFLDWLAAPEPGAEGAPLSRYLRALHRSDPTLRARFPDPESADREAYLSWAGEQAEREPEGILGRLAGAGHSSAGVGGDVTGATGLRTLAPGDGLDVARGEIVVCIPVYGGTELLAECLGSVLAYTDPAVPLLVADDASPDPAVAGLLESMDRAGRFADRRLAYLRQPENLGFPGNVNSAFEACSPADVVVLNSDCVVAAGWLAGLRRAAYSDALVATASALTNHGTILSVPMRNRPQPDLPQETNLERAAAAVLAQSLRLHPRLPTAVGHCMFVRRQALDLVGGFDLAFSPGYGEEVDFSQRCVLHGLVHVAADDVLVLHRGGGTFGEESSENPTRQQHERVIEARYPYYARAQSAAGADDRGPLARALSTARRAMLGITATIDARCLGPIVTGTQIHTLEVIRALSRGGRVHLRVIVPPDLGEHARSVLAELDRVALMPHTDVRPGIGRSDIAHRPYQVSSSADLDLLALTGERVVITHQDLIAYRNPGYFPGFRQWQEYQRLTARALALADSVVFFSNHAATDASREDLVAATRSRVVYIGVDHAGDGSAGTQPAGVEQLGEQPMLLCLGTDFRHKNRVFALRLLAALREQEGWNGKLVLAGPRVNYGSSAGDEASYLAHHPELDEHVIRLPAVSEGEKDWLLERCSAVLYPTTFEGFGLMPFEAAAAGRPCLFATHTALTETLPAELATLVPWDAEQSARRVAALLGDEQAIAEHVRATVRAGSRFNWESAGAQLTDVYYETVASRAREGARMIAELTAMKLERDETERKYNDLWLALTPQARALVAPGAPVDAATLDAVGAIAKRGLTRSLLLGPIRLVHRLLGGSPPSPIGAAPSVAPETFALHFEWSNREHMRGQLAAASEQAEGQLATSD